MKHYLKLNMAMAILKPGVFAVILLGIVFLSGCLQQAEPHPLNSTVSLISVPPEGQIYHGVYPGGKSGEEDDITLEDLRSYENLAGKPAAWVYFSDNWYRGREFPLSTATWIRDAGSVPYIRLMMRSRSEEYTLEPTFTLERIIDGDFDSDLRAWARSARDFGSPLIVEYGTEVNGQWFPWNGVWNGAGNLTGYGNAFAEDGPEKFRDAYRHIVRVMREENAGNIVWVFHADSQDDPEVSWNRMEEYYPGDNWVDWLAVSVYGAQTPSEEECPEFSQLMDVAYPRIVSLSSSKPIIIAEFGATRNSPFCNQSDWARNALSNITSSRWPRVIGFSWWNEAWENDENPAHNSDMRLQDNPELAKVFELLIGKKGGVIGKLIFDADRLPIQSID